MEVFVLGLNHKTAPIELREKLSVPAAQAQQVLQELRDRSVFDERVLLSTCNRTEIYGAGSTDGKNLDEIKKFLSDYSHLNLSTFENNLYVLRQPQSVEHLFAVTSGLDSMVVGETEIIGQVKDAYFSAQKSGQTGKVLNNLFQRSFKVAKDLRSHTDIGSGRVSVASVAVDLAEKVFESLQGSRVMVLGTGEMASSVTRAMVSHGAKALIISSRHHDRAVEMASELGGEALEFDSYEARINQVDVFIASTSAPKPLITSDEVSRWMKVRHDKPIFLIDIAVPRNIDKDVQKIDNVYLYNIDDLQKVADENKALRESQLVKCWEMIGHQTGHFMRWLQKEFAA